LLASLRPIEQKEIIEFVCDSSWNFCNGAIHLQWFWS